MMKRVVAGSLLGAAVIGGAASIGAGAASADPWHPVPGPVQHQPGNGYRGPVNNGRPVQYRTPGENPQWRPGPVWREGRSYQPVWDGFRHHWGFWLGPIWIPIG